MPSPTGYAVALGTRSIRVSWVALQEKAGATGWVKAPFNAMSVGNHPTLGLDEARLAHPLRHLRRAAIPPE